MCALDCDTAVAGAGMRDNVVGWMFAIALVSRLAGALRPRRMYSSYGT